MCRFFLKLFNTFFYPKKFSTSFNITAAVFQPFSIFKLSLFGNIYFQKRKRGLHIISLNPRAIRNAILFSIKFIYCKYAMSAKTTLAIIRSARKNAIPFANILFFFILYPFRLNFCFSKLYLFLTFFGFVKFSKLQGDIPA